MRTDDAAELAQTLFEEIGDAAFVVDPATMRLLDVNPMAQRLTGLPRQELMTQPLGRLFRSDGDGGLAHLQRALHTTQTFHSQEGYHLRRGQGAVWTPVNLTLTRLHTENRPLGLILARDISERIQAAERLRLTNAELEARVRDRTADLARANDMLRLEIAEHTRAAEALRLRDRAIQAVTQGVLITDASLPDNPIIYASEGFGRLTGYATAEVLGKNCRFLQGKDTDKEAVARLREAVRSGRPCEAELLNYKKDGTPFWVDLSVSPVRDDQGRLTHFVGIQTDLTERRRLEEQIRQSQKMEAIGQLAGGVAHDFNNLLTVITGYSEMLLAELPVRDPRRDPLTAIREAGEQAARLTSQLLAFSRKANVQPKVLDLNEVIDTTGKMLRRLIGEDVALTTTLSPAPGWVRIDPGQVEQVVLNLAVNARDAMPRGGRLALETAHVEIHADGPDLKPGRYVRLTVSDTGSGIADEVKPRIFEPFFTTKERGKGTGLGLATVYGIVKQAGGHVSLDSRVGVGTTFAVLLPAVAPPDARTGLGKIGVAPRGTETVLLAEDEDVVRRLARLALEMQGYAVLEVSSGADALRAAEGHAGPIHLLVTDVVMPDLGGRELANAVRARRQGVKVLFMSGYTDDAVVRYGVSEDGDAFLQKPFTPLVLARKVRAVLDERS
jgi:two-component system, cell cycle sensor histidine kinase and response regulator CckA